MIFFTSLTESFIGYKNQNTKNNTYAVENEGREYLKNLQKFRKKKHPARKPTKIGTKSEKPTKKSIFFGNLFFCRPSIAPVALDQLLTMQLGKLEQTCSLTRLDIEILKSEIL